MPNLAASDYPAASQFVQQQPQQQVPQPGFAAPVQGNPLAATLPRDPAQFLSDFVQDADAGSLNELGFQRKKRFGLKNGSDNVRVCLEQPAWSLAMEAQQRALAAQEADAEAYFGSAASSRRFKTEGARRAEEHFEKIGHPWAEPTPEQALQKAYAEKLSQLQRKLSAQQAELQRTQEAAQALAFNTSHALQLKQQQQRARQAWQQQSLQAVLDREDPAFAFGQPQQFQPQQQFDNNATWGFAQQQQQAQQSQQHITPDRQSQLSSLSRDDKSVQVPSKSSSTTALLQQPQQQQQQQARPSTAGANSGGKSNVTLAARLAAAHLGEADPLEEERQQLAKAGLGNTLLGSPHDPRELHDPASIDVVWRRREEARQRAKKLHAALGITEPLHRAGEPDAEASRNSELKQMSRRVKIQAFERRHTEERLAKCTTPFTRDMSETWMGVVVGKPPFAAFGCGNTSPANGGLIYGDYMASHNVSPEKKPNRPDQKQVMDQARRVAETKKKQDAKSLKRLLRQAEQDPSKKEERALLWQAAESLENQGRPRTAAGSKSHRRLGSASSRAAVQVVQPAYAPLYEPATSAVSASQQQQAADERALAQGRPLTAVPQVTGSQGIHPSSQQAQNGNARNVGGGALGDPSSWALAQAQPQPSQRPPGPPQQFNLNVAQAQAQAIQQAAQQGQFQPVQHGSNVNVAAPAFVGWRGGFSDSRVGGSGDVSSPPSGRRHNYPSEQVIGGNNSLADTTARTMSVLPVPERQPTPNPTPAKQQATPQRVTMAL